MVSNKARMSYKTQTDDQQNIIFQITKQQKYFLELFLEYSLENTDFTGLNWLSDMEYFLVSILKDLKGANSLGKGEKKEKE